MQVQELISTFENRYCIDRMVMCYDPRRILSWSIRNYDNEILKSFGTEQELIDFLRDGVK